MLSVSVKHAGSDLTVSTLDAEATVGALKDRLESETGVFTRHMKLIFKGKVLEDKSSLAQCKIGDGAKLMLLVSTTGQVPKQPGTQAPASCTSRAAAAASSRPRLGATSSSQGQPGAATSSRAHTVSLPDRKQTWSKMGVVALRDLALEAVPPECFEGLSDVRGADLSQNRLTAVPSSISQLASLSALRLADNQLPDQGVPWEALVRLQGLTLLALDRNALTRLPAALGPCSGLVRLSATGNRLVEVEAGLLSGMASLRELDLADNTLTALPSTIGSCSNLEDLNASNNQLASIPQQVTCLSKLQSLRLDNNRIKTLPDGLFGSCINLAALLLRSNPITVEALRTAPDFQQYEERRRARTNKQLGGRVMSDIERGFCEGADVGLWEHYKK